MIGVKPIKTKNQEEMAKSIQKGAEEFVMDSLKKSGADSYLESIEMKAEFLAGQVGNKYLNRDEMEHEMTKRRKGRSAFVYFKR